MKFYRKPIRPDKKPSEPAKKEAAASKDRKSNPRRVVATVLPKPPHPGKTEAQRRFLDMVGCGENSPPSTERTVDALLDAGLIYVCGYKVVGKDRFREIQIPQYEMTIPTHMQWCEHMAWLQDEDC